MAKGHLAQQLIHCLSPVKTERKEVGELHMGSEDGLVVSLVECIVQPSLVGVSKMELGDGLNVSELKNNDGASHTV